MSSLCAMYAWNALVDRDLLERMVQRMLHRGEKSEWWAKDSVGLATTICSNQNIATVVQSLPISWQSETYWIAADARLDYRAVLLNRLKDQLHRLENASDLELIVASYAQWGDACVKYLEGDYAFVLWDAERRRLFGARSVVGLRPFFYHVTPQRFLCASDPVQLFEDPIVSRSLNSTWVAFWLTQGQGHWDETIYRDIQVLPPGHWFIVDDQGIKIKSFWQPMTYPHLHMTRQEEYTEMFRVLLTEAVQTRIQDHRLLCFDLSGGLDSSSLVSLAATLWAQEKKAYPLYSFHAYSDDSLSYVHAVVEKYPIVEVNMLPFQEHLYFDGAFDPCPWMALPCRPTLFLASFYRELWTIAAERGIQAHVRGDFGDELLGASLDYLLAYWREHRIGKLIGEICQWHQVQGITPGGLLEQWVIHPDLIRRSQEQSSQQMNRISWLRPGVQQQSKERIRNDEMYFRELCPDPFARELVQWVYFHTDYSIQGSIALAMAGLETREPYTDLRLIEFLLRTSPQYQIRPDQRKFLLRETMRDTLPEIVRQRKGKGRAYRLYFQGFKKHRERLRQVILQMPELLTPYIDQAPLLEAIDCVALGGQANVPALSGAIALVLWAHRLPWADGSLPVVPR